MRAIGRNIVAATFAVTLVVSPAAFGADAKPEKTDVKIAVGGKSFMISCGQNIGLRLLSLRSRI